MFDDKWYKYNDSVCSLINNEPKLDKIFFLFYIKVGSDATKNLLFKPNN